MRPALLLLALFLLSCDDTDVFHTPRDLCDRPERHPCKCGDDEDEDSDWALAPLSVCEDCTKATAGGCDDKGGDCTRPECGTTKTRSFTGRVDCIKDCADGSVHRVSCE